MFINVKGIVEEENNSLFSWVKGFIITKLHVKFYYNILSAL